MLLIKMIFNRACESLECNTKIFFLENDQRGQRVGVSKISQGSNSKKLSWI